MPPVRQPNRNDIICLAKWIGHYKKAQHTDQLIYRSFSFAITNTASLLFPIARHPGPGILPNTFTPRSPLYVICSLIYSNVLHSKYFPHKFFNAVGEYNSFFLSLCPYRFAAVRGPCGRFNILGMAFLFLHIAFANFERFLFCACASRHSHIHSRMFHHSPHSTYNNRIVIFMPISLDQLIEEVPNRPTARPTDYVYNRKRNHLEFNFFSFLPSFAVSTDYNIHVFRSARIPSLIG